jgi:hypothetical protein
MLLKVAEPLDVCGVSTTLDDDTNNVCPAGAKQMTDHSTVERNELQVDCILGQYVVRPLHSELGGNSGTG